MELGGRDILVETVHVEPSESRLRGELNLDCKKKIKKKVWCFRIDRLGGSKPRI